jgi:uncharacterized protein (TIGR03067 family)
MRLAYLALFVFAALTCCGCRSRTSSTSAGPSDPQDLKQLEGTWHVTAIEAAGKPVPPERVQAINLQYVFDGDRLTIRRPGRPDESSTFSVDSSASPKRMTINQSPPVRALYVVDGTKLRLCLMVDDKSSAGFPSEMVSRPSPKTDLLTLERRAAPTQGPSPGNTGPTMYVYSQSTGKLTLDDQVVCLGSSGKGAAKNDPSKQADRDGPIPIGEYMLTGFREDPKLGGKYMDLMPVAGTNFFKRWPAEPFAFIAQTDNPPTGCFILVGRDVLEKLSSLNTRLKVVK